MGDNLSSQLLISMTGPERRVAIIENGSTVDVMREAAVGDRLVGNVYKGRVVRVLPGMQSAFLELGLARTAFLYAGDLLDPNRAENTNAEGVRHIPPIADRLKEGQELIVQVAKEPMGTKGARVTSQITLPGRYMVYMPAVNHVGVSRRIEDADERERLRTIAEAMCPEGGGVIVRTAGEGFDEESLREDLAFLITLWADISKKIDSERPPALLHQDLDISLRTTRDVLRPDFDGVIVDCPKEYERLAGFLDTFMPRCRPLLKLDEENPPLFTRYGVEHEISRAMDRKVWLKSGGSIVIDQTEALTAIDVNTGRYVGKSNFEDTILKINLEAVKEIVYQLRLRNIGGIIVIDFIDMAVLESRQMVYDALLDGVSHDKVRTRVLPMSPIGLVEMTRKRVRESLTQMMAQPCSNCDGRGWTLTAAEIARQTISKVRDTIAGRKEPTSISVDAHPKVVEFIHEDYRDQVAAIERRHGVQINIKADPSCHVEHFEVRGR
ncbi:MAG: ribonuclease G [Myxococcota bacterium]